MIKIPKFLISIVIFSAVLLILLNSIYAYSASNTVAESGLDYEAIPITANQAKPYDCAELSLTNIIANDAGSSSSDLLLGTAGDNSLNGNDGDDCIYAGSGNDTIDGGDGYDICIGGSGLDTFTNCEEEIDL